MEEGSKISIDETNYKEHGFIRGRWGMFNIPVYFKEVEGEEGLPGVEVMGSTWINDLLFTIGLWINYNLFACYELWIKLYCECDGDCPEGTICHQNSCKQLIEEEVEEDD